MNEDKLHKKIKEQVGEKMLDENPFISSNGFMNMMELFAKIPRLLLFATNGPAEFLNGFLSLIVTCVANIPDKIWDALREATEHPNNKGTASEILFKHLDGIRSYDGGKLVKWTADELKDDTPPINVKPPTTPC